MAEYKKKTDNPKMGRPKVEIEQEQFEKLCALQCTEVEIASWFKCSIDTIENFCKKTYKSTFSDIYKSLSAFGRISLRRNQFKMAEHNCSMAIWLGKQYLDQKEKVEAQVDGNGMLKDILGYMEKKGE